MNQLTAKQERFCQEYMVDLSATQAAIRSGYSENTAKSIGCENLTKPDIEDRIEELQRLQVKRIQATSDQVIAGLASVAFFDASNMFDDQGDRKPFNDLDAEAQRMGGVVPKVSDRIKALESLGRHLGLFDANQDTEERQHVVIHLPDNGRSLNSQIVLED